MPIYHSKSLNDKFLPSFPGVPFSTLLSEGGSWSFRVFPQFAYFAIYYFQKATGEVNMTSICFCIYLRLKIDADHREWPLMALQDEDLYCTKTIKELIK
jgi:hypothetical protein